MSKEATVSLEIAKTLGLNEEEYNKIQEIMGRMPNFTELSIYSVMWSEHCSYKNSINLLKTLPKSGPHILAEAGEENAGLVDIGDGLACAFKIESHNHPSAIEPYQGAATGVGGINRDVFTMGARPIAQLNSLRFGSLEEDRTKWHLKGAVKGIGDYGNSFGIPVLGGEVYFDECYNTNPLINAMSVGIVETGKQISATSYGIGNPVFIVGSTTGRDGIHGATFASGDITETSADDLPSVQVGDPFQEKLLLEATMELAGHDYIIGMQDMGAAGITCSTCEMSAKGEHGMRIDLDKVPTRREGMLPFEILLSESQERMLVVVKKGNEDKVQAIFDKWDLPCVNIGEVTEGGQIEFLMNGELVAEVNADSLVLGGGAPVYTRESKEPAYLKQLAKFKLDKLDDAVNFKKAMEMLVQLPNISSKRYVYEQYDSMVGTVNKTTNQPSDAGVVYLKGTDKALAVTVDCNARYVYADPRKGASIAVAEAARNIVCSGGKPSAITNCLNFGNPYNPEVYYQFENAIKGMGEACEAFKTPVTGGNVSFYNQTSIGGTDTPVYPTPTIGMVGVIEKKAHVTPLGFQQKGDLIFQLGKNVDDLNSSQILEHYYKIKDSPAPYFNLEEEEVLARAVRGLIKAAVVTSAHDCSEGGLTVTLLEKGFVNNFGFDILTSSEVREDAFLFGESQGRIVITVDQDNEDEFLDYMHNSKVDVLLLGHVTKGNIRIDDMEMGDIAEYKKLYDEALEKKLG